MKNIAIIITGLMLFLANVSPAQVDTTAPPPVDNTALPFTEPDAGINPPAPSPLTINGYLFTDDRWKLYDKSLGRQEYRLSLKTEFKPGDRSRIYAETWVRTYSSGIGSADHGSADFRGNVQLREAYADIYGLFCKNLDLRIGRQRIAWGTADKLNPTDLLNPYDMEDVWDFGRHLGSNAIKLNYYAGSFTFTGVAIPLFEAPVLPGSECTAAFMPSFILPEMIYDSTTVPGLTIPTTLFLQSSRDSIVLPEKNLKHSPSFGIKVKKSLGNFDVSLSYIYGRDQMPAVSRLHTTLVIDSLLIFPSVKAHALAHVRAEAVYPHISVAGFDFAGSLWNLGIWGEAACILPSEVVMKRSLSYSIPSMNIAKDSLLADTVVVESDPYVRFIIGMDYTFRNGIYVNIQYLHGFMNERGSRFLNDYFIVSAEWKLLQDKITLAPLNSGIQLPDFRKIGSSFAWLYMPEISYRPVDNTELSIGAHLIEGRGDASFARAQNNDEIFLKFRYSF